MEIMEVMFNFLFRKKLTILVYFNDGRCRSFSARSKNAEQHANDIRKVVATSYRDGSNAYIGIGGEKYINVQKTTAIEIRTGWLF